jgi:hypothetical protein
MSEVEDFANRLSTAIGKSPIVTNVTIQSAIQSALHPPHVNVEYPRMLYRDREQRVVSDAGEEQAAQAEGWDRQPPALFEPDFPCWMIERPPSLGGTKHWDLRGVLLRSPSEMKQFESLVEADDWYEDKHREHGARAVGLSELVQEHKQHLHALVEREQLEMIREPAEVVELPYETNDAQTEETPGAAQE